MATDSLIGFATGTLSDPLPDTHTDSLIGFASNTLSNPIGKADSAVGFASGVIRNPHYPIGVMTPDGLKYVPIQSWDGAHLI